MPKRKDSASSDEGSDAPISQKAPLKKKATAPTIKKPKFEANKESTSKQDLTDDNSNEIKVLVNAEGDKYIDLGKKRRAVVRSFKGVALLDIREYYGEPGEEKPGKKGISLNLDQWKLLSGRADVIDKLFADQKKAADQEKS
ncbi:hypothetical protein HYPSUDRAFT_43785 [Hypholoma sublateritium FD-334 SS-4]|uniref:Transcriptional coactivator p15 (PC4) C-terminal domain-containing protein n=1 Tax=Hypholoma sublateritium (strain FD-334 SS-4) TaxID=945553 RepID=A0A0D2NLX0_HYPSF|nr:hypothetical protein HYPSUDRAFT_43785 [Hypholoma sublateritium FD-334 SS-4]